MKILEKDKVRILKQSARVLLSSSADYERKFIINQLVELSLVMGTDEDEVSGQVLEITKSTEENLKATNERIAQIQQQEEQKEDSVMLDMNDLEDNYLQL